MTRKKENERNGRVKENAQIFGQIKNPETNEFDNLMNNFNNSYELLMHHFWVETQEFGLGLFITTNSGSIPFP